MTHKIDLYTNIINYQNDSGFPVFDTSELQLESLRSFMKELHTHLVYTDSSVFFRGNFDKNYRMSFQNAVKLHNKSGNNSKIVQHVKLQRQKNEIVTMNHMVKICVGIIVNVIVNEPIDNIQPCGL